MEETWICPGCLKEIAGKKGICPACGFDSLSYSPPEDALPLYTLAGDRYLVGAVIGRGGFGITYAALDRKLRRRVALKELYIRGITVRSPGGAEIWPAPGKEEALERLREAFLEEARVLSLLNMEGAVRILDCFGSMGTSCLVMEYLTGETLQERISRDGPMEEKRVLRGVKILAEALQGLHRKGILHLDISPENIMLTEDGRVLLIDFGLSRNLYAQILETTYALKPGYAPPEQYVKGERLLPSADIYGLGAVCYFALTGRRPGSDAAESFPPGSRVSGKTVKLLRRAMAGAAADRYQTVEEMMEEMNKKPVKKNVWILLAAAGILAGAAVWYLGDPGSRDAFLEKEERAGEEPAEGSGEVTAENEEQPDAMEEGDVMPGISGLFNISCVSDTDLLLSVSQDPSLAEPEIIIWERVWDETQEFYVENAADDAGGSRIYPMADNEDLSLCLTLEEETGRILVRKKDPEDPLQIFRLIYAGGDRMLIQAADEGVLGVRPGGKAAENGSIVLVRPYEDLKDPALEEWMLEFPR